MIKRHIRERTSLRISSREEAASAYLCRVIKWTCVLVPPSIEESVTGDGSR